MSMRIFNVRVKDDLYQAMSERAAQSGMDMSHAARAAFEAWVMATPRVGTISRLNQPTGAKPDPDPEALKADEKIDRATCPHPKEKLSTTPWGVKLCQRCGTKIA